MTSILTERLRIIALTHQQLLLLKSNSNGLYTQLGFQACDALIEPEYDTELIDALDNFWLPNTLLHPDKYMWYTNWLITIKGSNVCVGGIGFGGFPPDGAGTDVGYMLYIDHRRNGYATEALSGIVKWAFGNSDAAYITASTQSHNLASQRVLLNCGFEPADPSQQEAAHFKLNR